MIARKSPDDRLTSYFANDYWFVRDSLGLIYISKQLAEDSNLDVVAYLAVRFGVKDTSWLEEECARWRESPEYRWNL